jgi:hypothetical protein
MDLSILETPCCECGRRRPYRPEDAVKADLLILAVSVGGLYTSILAKNNIMALLQSFQVWFMAYIVIQDFRKVLNHLEERRQGLETDSEASSSTNTSMEESSTEGESEMEEKPEEATTDCSGNILEELSDDGSSTDSEMPGLISQAEAHSQAIRRFLEPDDDDHLSDEEKKAVEALLDLGLQNESKED